MTTSLRIARREAKIAIDAATARTIAAAEALLAGTGTVEQWRRAVAPSVLGRASC